MPSQDKLMIAGREFSSRLLVGTGKFSHPDLLIAAVSASKTDMVTLALKRIDAVAHTDDILQPLTATNVELLPNTAGARNAKEAVLAAHLARELLGTNWVKLEIHPDPRYLMPDPIETLAAAKTLCDEGFHVLPYIHADPLMCKRLEDVGCAAVMPLGSPIGSNQGLETQAFIKIIIEQACVPVIVDAGIGAPSHAAKAMEMGADAVLVNTAIATSGNPELMACAFKNAVIAGRNAFVAGLGAMSTNAVATSPVTGFLDD